MSAFFVGTDHINAMLTFALRRGRRFGVLMPGGYSQQSPTNDDMTAIGLALISENIKSLEARYPRDYQCMVPEGVEDYQFTPDNAWYNRSDVGPCGAAIAAIKLANCYDYQSCEHDGWDASWSKRFVNWLIDTAVNTLPGYDDAPWSYRETA